MPTNRPVFKDTVTTIPAVWANALTTLLYDVFKNASTVVEARKALGLGTFSFQDGNAVNITGGSIDNTPIGLVVPAQAQFTKASAQFDPVTDVDLVNLRSARKLVRQELTPYLKSGEIAEKLYVTHVDKTSTASVPNTGWVDTRSADKVKDAPLSRRTLVVKDRVLEWEGFPVDNPFPENFELTLVSSGATLPFNFFPDEAATSLGKDPAVEFKVPDEHKLLTPNVLPTDTEKGNYIDPTVAKFAYKVMKHGTTVKIVLLDQNLNNLAIEVKYHHNTFNYLTMSPLVNPPAGPLKCIPAWANPINTPMGYMEDNAGDNVISESHTVVRNVFIGCIVKSGILGDSVVDWDLQWGPLYPEGAAHPPKLVKISTTEAMIEIPKAVEDHYYEGCLKVKLIVNGVRMGKTQWLTLSNMEQPNNFKDGRVAWGVDEPPAGWNPAPVPPVIPTPPGTNPPGSGNTGP